MIDPLNKFASFHSAVPDLLAKIFKPRVKRPVKNTPPSGLQAFKEWSKLFTHDILKHENAE